MSSVYPEGFDSFTNPTANDRLDSVVVPHAQQHTDVNDAVEAIEAELGLNPSGIYATVDARIDDIQTTVVAPITNSGSAVNTVLGLNIDGNLEVNGSGRLKVTDDLTAIDSVTFDQTAAEVSAVGKLFWDDVNGTLSFGAKGGNVTIQIGQEHVQLAKHADNSGLVNGKAVYIVGSDGSNLTCRYAMANAESTSSKTFGVVTEDASGGAKAFVTLSGMVRGLDTSTLVEGGAIWLSATVPGGLTTTKPSSPAHLVLMGWCVRSHATQGEILVHVANGYELEELHDVLIVSAVDGDVLRYDSVSGLWKNSQVVGPTGPQGPQGPQGVKGDTGDSGVAVATSPITYDALSKTVAFDQSAQNTTNDGRYARLAAANAFTVGGHTITTTAAVVPLTLKGASGQTADIFNINNNSGTLVYRVTEGSSAQTGHLTVGSSTLTALSAMLNVNNTVSTRIGAVIRGAASQSANLQEWQNSAGTVQASISASGKILGQQVAAAGSVIQLQWENSGGVAKFVKGTAAATNPGSGQASLYFRDGTTAGTLKLCVRAGTAGAETTILDNIPQ